MTLPENASAELVSAPNAKRRGLLLLAMWILLAEIAALIIWLGAGQPWGSVIVVDDKMTISYWQRLWPLGALTLCGLAFTFVVQTTDIVSRAVAVPGFLAKSHRAIVGLWIAVGFAGAMLAVWTLRAFANSSDEYDFLFQAQTFLA